LSIEFKALFASLEGKRGGGLWVKEIKKRKGWRILGGDGFEGFIFLHDTKSPQMGKLKNCIVEGFWRV